MNDDQGKKEEEKLEFTQEGEALGYIGLDDARILALEHARDNRDFYDGKYARRDLLWEVLGQEGMRVIFLRRARGPGLASQCVQRAFGARDG